MLAKVRVKVYRPGAGLHVSALARAAGVLRKNACCALAHTLHHVRSTCLCPKAQKTTVPPAQAYLPC